MPSVFSISIPGYQAGATKVKKVLLNAGGAACRRSSMPELTELPGCVAYMHGEIVFTRTQIHASALAHVHTRSLTHALTRIPHTKHRCPTDVAQDEYRIKITAEGERMI